VKPKDKGKDKELKWPDVLSFVDPVKDKIEGTWRRGEAHAAAGQTGEAVK